MSTVYLFDEAFSCDVEVTEIKMDEEFHGSRAKWTETQVDTGAVKFGDMDLSPTGDDHQDAVKLRELHKALTELVIIEAGNGEVY